MRRKPFDDIRVRKALTLLFNREQMIENCSTVSLAHQFRTIRPLFTRIRTIRRTRITQEAFKLLADAGWKDRDSSGTATKNGQPLQVEITLRTTVRTMANYFPGGLRRVGITLSLRLVTFPKPHSNWKCNGSSTSLSAPGVQAALSRVRVRYHSETADIENTNNITVIKTRRSMKSSIATTLPLIQMSGRNCSSNSTVSWPICIRILRDGMTRRNASCSGINLECRQERFPTLASTTDLSGLAFPSSGGSTRIRTQSWKKRWGIRRSKWISRLLKITTGRNTERKRK